MKLDTRLFVVLFVIILNARGDEKVDKPNEADSPVLAADDPKSLREMIDQANNKMKPVRLPSNELAVLKDTLKKAPSASSSLSENLTKALKDSPSDQIVNSVLGFDAASAIADPNINVIDSDVAQITANSSAETFEPDQDEMKRIFKANYRDSNLLNFYRENLKVDLIQEEKDFKIGEGVEQWKTLVLSLDKTALVGRSASNVVFYIGLNESYEKVATVPFDVEPGSKLLIVTLKLWDSNQNRARHLVLAAVNQQLVWHELIENEVMEFQRWNLLKEIDSMVHFSHEGTEILLISTVDAQGKVQAELIEFNVPEDEFWVLQVFPLQSRSTSMTPLDLGRDFIVAFVQNNAVLIYRHETTQHSRGKFTLFKTIEAANVSTISGFRIGGYSYLAIGGDEPRILRFFNNDFVPQTILSQSFGFVEEFFPVTIRTYRDDLMLLVQHRLQIGTHSIIVIDALIWNGIAFENALSVPCTISADPNANGFTCMLDLERDKGLIGAEFIHIAKEQRLYILVPRYEVHSGLFRVKYSMIEAEDPVMKDLEQMKKSIELINQMLEYEETVKMEVETAMACALNPMDDFTFENLNTIEEIETDFLELDKNVVLESDVIEFIGVSWTQEDFLINLDELEATVAENEHLLRVLDDDLNRVHSNNRQVRQPRDSELHHIGTFNINGKLETMTYHPARQPRQQEPTESSQVHYFSVPANGQIDPKSFRIEPQDQRRQPKDRRRPSRQAAAIEESIVSSLRVKNIELETINGIPFEDLLFLENGQLIIPDMDVVFMDSVQLENINMLNDGKINGVDFSHEVLAVESPNPVRNLKFDSISVQSLEVKTLNDVPVDLESLKTLEIPNEALNLTAKSVIFSDDLNIETVNGIAWDEFAADLVPKHLPSSIPEVHVDGDIILVGEASSLNVDFLNGLPFPSGYVLKDGKNGTVITGKKTFLNELVTAAIDTGEGGTIDGIEPSNMITLDQDQSILGETTFSSLEVMKKLEVQGTISGRELENFLPNPTLQEAFEIAASVSFNELIVEGEVIIEDSLNGENLEKVLSDVVYESTDGSDVVIKAPKVFKNLEVQGDISIASNFINDINLDNIMMTDRAQTATFTTLSGKVFFSNLKLRGLFDGINATELERNSIRTFGDQFIETPLVIGLNHRLEARAVEVKNKLNHVPIGEYIFIDKPIELASVNFNNLKVDELILEGDITGSGVFRSLNVTDIATNYLSKSRKQKITVPTTIHSLTTNGTFSANTINGMDFDEFLKYMRRIKNFKKTIFSGALPIKDLIIEGNVEVKGINGRDFNEILQNVIWLNRPNYFEEPITFLDDVVINKELTLQGNFNEKPFQTFVDNWISKTENPVVIHAGKVFGKDFIVENSVETKTINGINFEDLLMVTDVLEARDLNIIGTVHVKNLNVGHTFNGAFMKDFKELYSYDSATNTHVIKSDVHFNQPITVDYLETPIINNYNVSERRANMIGLNESNVYITSHKVFINSITTQQGFHATYINDIPTDFLDRIVLANEASMVTINGDLEFSNDVYAQLIAVSGDLYTRFINGCDILEWTRVGLMTNRKLELDGTLHFDASALKAHDITVDYINGIPFKDFITIGTDQTFNHTLKVADLYVKNPLIVRETVNGIKIEAERENTVMRNAPHQIVTAKTSFTSTRVYDSMTAKGKVYSRNIEDVVLLDSSPTIASAVNFRSLEASSLYSENLVSGVNLQKWYENLVWARGKDEQVITGNWKIKNLKFAENVTGNGLINDLHINDIAKNMKNNFDAIEKAIANYSEQYHDLCNALSASANMSLYSIHILKHFELDFRIKESTEIFSHFAFTTKTDGNFFLVNTNCTTHVYKWQKMVKQFKKLYKVMTGVVYEWSLVKSANGDIFIVTSSKMEAEFPCQLGGLNVWKMNGDQLFHVTTIATEAEVLELHASQVLAGRFYALDNLDHVIHFDVFGQKKEFWQLPNEHLNYSFLPPEVTRDLTLLNGRKVFMLESRFKQRHTRSFLTGIGNDMKPKFNSFPLGETRVDPLKLHDLNMIRQHTTPSIPASPLMTSEERIHFLTKVRQVGESVQKSLKESFSGISKLTIKSNQGERLVSTRPLRPTTLTKDRTRPTTETSPMMRQDQTEKSEDKLLVTETTQEQVAATLKEEEITTESGPAKNASKKTSFMIKQTSEAKPNPKSASDSQREIFSTFMEKLKSLSESVQSVLNLRKEMNESGVEDTQVGEQLDSTEGSSATSETTEPSSEANESTSSESSSTTEWTSTDSSTKSSTEFTSEATEFTSEATEFTSEATEFTSAATEFTSAATEFTSEATEFTETSESSTKIDTTSEKSKESLISSTLSETIESISQTASTAQAEPPGSLPKAPRLGLPSIPITPRIVIQTEAATQANVAEDVTLGAQKFPDHLPEVFPDKFDMALPEPSNTLPDDFEDKPDEELGDAIETSTQEQNSSTKVGDKILEQDVPVEILTGSGIRETDNPYIPERGAGEFIMMYAGPNNHKRPLYAITRNRNSFIIGNNNIIEIYSDIFEGFIYQYIHCSDPSHLVALHFRDETLFAFLESRNEIQVYVYRGIQGFISFKRIKLPGYAVQMTSLSLPPKIDYKCDHHYLVVKMEMEILFYGVKIDGNCGMRNVKCDDL